MRDATTAAGLGAKLDALELTAEEQALLTDLLTPADAEVTGYTSSFTAMLSGASFHGMVPPPTRTGIIANFNESGAI